MSEKNNLEESSYKYLYQIPPKIGEYIILDVESTGLSKKDHAIEIGGFKIKNLQKTGDQFQFYIKPRTIMKEDAIKIHGMTNDFYDLYFKDIYKNEKQNLIHFLNWVGNSIIFSFNAPFDMEKINNELSLFGLKNIDTKNFRCLMRIFREIVGKIDSLKDEKFLTLNECCEFFGININKRYIHNTLIDSDLSFELMKALYNQLDENKELYECFNYDKQLHNESHYEAYKAQRIINKKINNYFNLFFIPLKNT